MRSVSIAYLASYVLSVLGNSIAAIALPLIVLETTGSALDAGIVAGATAVPAVLAGLLMGVVIDRINRRTSSIVTDLISAGALAALPLLDLFTDLDVGWFVLFAVIGSLGDVPGLTARDALLPAVVRHGTLPAERLMGARESLGAIGLLVGPAIAGGLIVLLDGTAVLWVTAATSAAAALITAVIPRRVGEIGEDADASAATTGWAQLREGWNALLSSRFLLVITMISVAGATLLASLQGLILPVYFTSIDERGLLGFVLSALAAGLLAGSLIYAMAGARLPRRTWLAISLVGTTVGFGVIAALAGAAAVLAGAFVAGVFNGLSAALLGVLMIERIPERLRGRIIGTQNAILTAAPPAGIMLAALLTEVSGVELAAAVVAAIWAVAALVTLSARATRELEPVAA